MKTKLFKRLLIILLFIIILIICNKTYAQISNLERYVELNFDTIQTDEGTFYKRKKVDYMNLYIPYPSTFDLNASSDEYNKIAQELKPIIENKTKEYLDLIIDKLPEEQKINKDYNLFFVDIYEMSNENLYKAGDDITGLVSVYASIPNGTNSYWKENFSNNEFYYDEYEEQYFLRTYCFVRLTISDENNDYEVAYIGRKPENYENYIAEIKEKEGIDLENLDVEKVLNTQYTDNIEIVPSSITEFINGSKTNYNSTKTEEVGRLSLIIRIIFIVILTIFIVYIIRKIRKK